MQARLKNLMASLRGLPGPAYRGELLRVVLRTETWEAVEARNPVPPEVTSAPLQWVTLVAQEYRRGPDRWLEWDILLPNPE